MSLQHSGFGVFLGSYLDFPVRMDFTGDQGETFPEAPGKPRLFGSSQMVVR